MKKKSVTGYALIGAGTALVVSILFLMMYYFWGDVHYQTDDDIAMNLIAAGALDADLSAYLVHSNIVYGYIIRLLFHLFPNHNMYLLLMLALNCLALTSIATVLGIGLSGICSADEPARDGRCRTVWLKVMVVHLFTGVLVNFLLGEYFYTELQFTENAGLYTAVGCMLYFAWVYHGCRWKNLSWVLAVGFLLFGYMVRLDSFKAAAGIFIIGLAAWLLPKSKIILRKARSIIAPKGVEKKDAIRRVGWTLGTFLLICALMLSVSTVHRVVYSEEDWKLFVEYNTYRSILLDFAVPDYGTYEREYNERGINQQDLIQMLTWNYYDPDKFTLENMKWMAELVQKEPSLQLRVDKRILVNALQQIKNRLLHVMLPTCWILLLLAAVLSKRKDLVFVFLAISGGILAEYYYLLCKGRFLWRVESLPWIGAVVIFSGFLAMHKGGVRLVDMTWGKALAIALVCLCFIGMEGVDKHSYFRDYKHGSYTVEQERPVKVVRSLRKRSENLYIYTTLSALQPKNRITDINRKYTGFYDNLCPTGGWTVPSPLHMKKLKKYGIRNPMLSLVENDGNVFLADEGGQQENIREYLERATGKPVEVSMVEIVHDCPIFRFQYAE